MNVNDTNKEEIETETERAPEMDGFFIAATALQRSQILVNRCSCHVPLANFSPFQRPIY